MPHKRETRRERMQRQVRSDLVRSFCEEQARALAIELLHRRHLCATRLQRAARRSGLVSGGFVLL